MGGLHAALPLLLFWLLAGLRSSFGFPVDLRSRWVFPIHLEFAPPQVFPGLAAKTAKTWSQLCCGALAGLLLVCLAALGWGARAISVQAACAAALSILLTDLFFLGRTQIPFTRARMPGLALAFILYAFFFPTAIGLTVQLELAAEVQPKLLLWLLLGTAGLHLALRLMDRMAQLGIIGGFPEDEIDPGPQTLGLFQ